MTKRKFLNKHYYISFDKSINVKAYTNARDVLGKAVSGSCPTAIFLDINMPEMDGWQFLEECQKLEFAKFSMLSSSIDPHRYQPKQYMSFPVFFLLPHKFLTSRIISVDFVISLTL